MKGSTSSNSLLSTGLSHSTSHRAAKVEETSPAKSPVDTPSSSHGSEPARDSTAWIRPALYGALNIFAATAIVFANKAVLSIYGFEFTTALTLLHTLTTIVGMTFFSQMGMFTRKSVPKVQVLHLLMGQ